MFLLVSNDQKDAGEYEQANNITTMGGRPGLFLMGWDSESVGCGFEFLHCILDGHFSQIFVVKIVMFV